MRSELTEPDPLLVPDPPLAWRQDASPPGLRTFVAVLLNAVALTVLLACGPGQAGRSLVDVEERRRAARGEILMQDLIHAISAYPFETVAALGEPSAVRSCLRPDPDFGIDIGVTSVRDGMLRIRARLFDTHSREAIGEFVTYRSRT